MAGGRGKRVLQGERADLVLGILVKQAKILLFA